MDIQHLVDRLEDLIDEGRHWPFTKFTLIDEERALELIDQMRISIPEEIEKSSRILASRDRVLAEANEEAARILQLARQKSEAVLEQEITVQAAHNRAANIIEEARQEAEAIIAGADQYVLDELSRLEKQLVKTLAVVRNGINEVNRNRSSFAPAYGPQDEEDAPASPFPTSQYAPQPSQQQREEVEVGVDMDERRK
jgi:hypothetical protein